MEKRIETAINLIMFLSLLATAWDLSLVHHLSWYLCCGACFGAAQPRRMFIAEA